MAKGCGSMSGSKGCGTGAKMSAAASKPAATKPAKPAAKSAKKAKKTK